MQSITEFLNTLRMNDLSDQTIKNVKRSLELLDDFKPLEECTKEDITAFIISINGKYKPSSLQVRKINIKQYFKAQGRTDLVEHIKIKKIFKEIDDSKLLTVDDINKLIEVTASLKYKAIWAVMWETGARINEVLVIERKDIIETVHGFEVKIYSSKTAGRTGNGSRKLLLIESAGHIRNYQIESTSSDTRLFPVGYDSTIRALRKAGKAAGIGGIYPHLIRHSRATTLVKENVQESIIRKQLGWTEDSPMIKRYVHLKDDDLIINQLQRAGIEKEDVLRKSGIIKPGLSVVDKLQKANRQQAAELEEMKVQMSQISSLLTGIMRQQNDDVINPDLMEELHNRDPGLLKSRFGIDDEEYQRLRDVQYNKLYGMTESEHEKDNAQKKKEFFNNLSEDEINELLYGPLD